VTIGNFELLVDPGEEKAAVLNPDEIKRLLRVASFGRNGKRNVAIIWMSFGSSLRVTEIANLKVKDVVTQDGEIRDEFRLPAAYTKNGESRLAYIVENEHRLAVQEYLNFRVERRLRLSKDNRYCGVDPESPLFLARGPGGFQFNKKRYTRTDGSTVEYRVCSSMQQLVSDLIKKVGVSGGSSHSGRRTFATRLADRGVDMEYIKYLLGHKTKQQSLLYIESNPKRLRNILKGIYNEI
jgi:integrase/recombinase XerD